MKILVATNNSGKLAEFQRLLNIPGLELVIPNNTGLGKFDVEETGQTFVENASLKAIAFAKESGLPALADDSGLEVDALGGKPGIFSKRYAGENATDSDRIAYLIQELEGISLQNRAARFVAVLVLANPDGHILASCTGYCDGKIGLEARGTRGFGYDPIFYPDEMPGRTMSELSNMEKDEVSHRGKAVRKMALLLKELLF